MKIEKNFPIFQIEEWREFGIWVPKFQSNRIDSIRFEHLDGSRDKNRINKSFGFHSNFFFFFFYFSIRFLSFSSLLLYLFLLVSVCFDSWNRISLDRKKNIDLKKKREKTKRLQFIICFKMNKRWIDEKNATDAMFFFPHIQNDRRVGIFRNEKLRKDLFPSRILNINCNQKYEILNWIQSLLIGSKGTKI